MTDVVYATGSVDGGNAEVELLLDVYQSGEACSDPRPFVIMIHGGGFVGGDKRPWGDDGVALAARDFVGVAINYRLFGDDPEPGPEIDSLFQLFLSLVDEDTVLAPEELQLLRTIASSVEDAGNAVEWVQENSEELCVDPDTFALWGSSAGAYISLLLGYALDDAGLTPIGQSVVIDHWGAQPVPGAMQTGDSPLFILHGDQDQTVDYAEALSLQADADLNQIPYSFYTVEDAGHGPDQVGLKTNGVDGVTFYDLTLNFIEAHLRDGTPLYETRTVPAPGSSNTQNFNGSVTGKLSAAELEPLFSNAQRVSGVNAGRAEIVSWPEAFQGQALAISLNALAVGERYSGAHWITSLPARDELYLSYRIRFEPGFDFGAGGTLTGLAGGNPDSLANGVDWWSAPVVWRPGGDVAQRLYHPGQTASTGDVILWEHGTAGQRQFRAGEWYTIGQYIRLNTPGQSDGVIEMSLNGELALMQQGVRFRDTANLRLNKLVFAAHYGGGDAMLQPVNDSRVVIDDLIISTHPIIDD